MKAKPAALVLLAAVLIAAVVYYTKHHTSSRVATDIDKNDPYMIALEKDKQVLSGASAATPENEIYGAMVRLAEIHFEPARDLALKLSESPSAYLREGAAQALGYFADAKSDAQLKKLLRDESPAIREAAIRALGRSPGAPRADLLAQVPSEKATPAEKIAMLESEFNLGKASGKESESLQKILALAKAGDDGLATLAATKLIELSPQWDQTVLIIRRKVETGNDVGLTAAGLRYLAGRRDPWLKERWKGLAASKSATIRKAVIQSLHRTCPPERKDLMLTFAREEIDPTVQDVLMQATDLMGEPWKKDVYQTLSPRIKEPYLKERLKDLSDKSGDHSGRTPCSLLEKEA